MHLGTRHVRVGKSGVRLYCSSDCMDKSLIGWREPERVRPAEEPPRARRGRLFAIGLGIASLSPCGRPVDMDERAAREVAAVMADRAAREAPRRFIGPPAPSDEELAREFMSELGADRWIHPLPGPVRRMPIRDSRVFGAAREGHRPGECRSGHCGVDIGGEIWGEPVYAVHDGVVDRVKRVNEGRGGLYVRLSHRDGTVFTQYFHLAAIPRDLRKGQRVRAGQVVGLVGDTGVQHSTAHLHFTISVKPTPHSSEIYMDPEPLIALWPLKVPREGGAADAAWDPGVPRGAAGRPRRPQPRRARAVERTARNEAARDEEAEAAEELAGAPAPVPPSAEAPSGAGPQNATVMPAMPPDRSPPVGATKAP
ncbi:MAG TPA: M23 family metallopeptidase [Kofleriaceae bacterium]|nr:M23 family metallopeptidase [Kofleriaceae bacterium]